MASYARWRRGRRKAGTSSPLLANIYLHYAFDLWVQQWRKRHARGEVYIVRYADDFVMGFQREQDALAMREALASRLAKFGLELHPDKTRVLRFGRYAQQDGERDGRKRPETFDFLGFTHIAGQNRRGGFQLKRRTSRKKRRGEARGSTRADAPAPAPAGSRATRVALQRASGALPVLRRADEQPSAAVVPRARPPELARPAPTAESTRAMGRRSAGGFRQALSSSASEDPPSLALSSSRCAVDPRWEPGAGNPLAGFCPGGGPS